MNRPLMLLPHTPMMRRFRTLLIATLTALLGLMAGPAGARGIRSDNVNWGHITTQGDWSSAIAAAGYPTSPVTGQPLLLFNFGGPPLNPVNLFGTANLSFYDGTGNPNILVYDTTSSDPPIDAQTLPDYTTCANDSNCIGSYPAFGNGCDPTDAALPAPDLLDYFQCNIPSGALNVEWGTTWQVLFFNLGSVPTGLGYDPSIYGPTGNALTPSGGSGWEIAFASNCTTCTDSATDAAGQPYQASLEFNGQIWTARASVLNYNAAQSPQSSLNEFVYYVDPSGKGQLYAPPGWLAATSTALTATPTTAAASTPIVLTATVSEVRGVVPTGTVTFASGATTLGSASLTNGTATLTKTL